MPEFAEPLDRPRRIVIIGGVAAGMSTATRLRRLDESADIVVLERGGYVSFANCGLAYLLGGVIDERDSLILQTPDKLAARFRLDVRVRHEVVSIDVAKRELGVLDQDAHALYHEGYDELVIATGARAGIPDVPGAERMAVLRSIEDMDRIAGRLDALPDGAPVAVVGGGYIGVEMADNLIRRGFSVTLIHRGDHLLSSLDPEMASRVEAHLRRVGVDVILAAEVTAVEDDAVVLDSGRTIEARLAIASVGVVPDAALAAAAGIRIGPTGGIAVDAFHRTSAPGVSAVGDVAEKLDSAGRPVLMALAGPANRDGRYLADTLAGVPTASPAVLGTAIVEVAGLTVASVGMTELAARAANTPVRIIHTHPASHAGYYPGAEPMSLKLVVDAATDRILGAQAVGGSGVDKRIDVIATAMSAGIKAGALSDLELAYAPQYGSAKDPINMLGYIARNMTTGQATTVQWHEVDERVAAGAVIVDVRTAAEYAAGSIQGAVNIPLDELRARASEIGGRSVIVSCQVGQRGHAAASLLRQLGFDAANLDGGYRTWTDGVSAGRLPESVMKGRP